MFIVKPYSDELLSSWFIRLARKNHTNVSTMICHIFKNDILSEHTTKLHIKDLDLYELNKRQKDILHKTTGIKIDKHQLFQYSGFLNDTVDRYQKMWIAEPRATKHNTKHFYGTRYCPKCLEEKPYIRQLWRILLYNICSKHNCYLKCECPSCDEQFMYYDNGYMRELYQCHSCGFDLRKSNIQHINNSKYAYYQDKLINILNAGYYKVNHRYHYSIGLFHLLISLMHTIMKTHHTSARYIKELKPYQVSRLLSHILFLLEKFPYRLNRYYKKKKLTDIHKILGWEDRDKQASNLPNWYLTGIEYRVITKKGQYMVNRNAAK